MNTQRLVDEFMEMVRINSLSKKEAVLANVLVEKLKHLGFDVVVDNAGEKIGGNTGNIIAKMKGSKNVSTVLFCAHMDTVVPGENIQPVLRDGIIYSDGTTILGADDKAGIAGILEAIRYIKENAIPHGNIEVVFTISEEGGLFGAKNLDYALIESKMAFILDSGGSVGEIIVHAPAQKKLHVKIKGKAAHAGIAPESGINAIQVAARAIDQMKLLRIDSETTANVGIIKGGTASNIVCDSVEMILEARSLNDNKLDAQVHHMIECIQNACEEYATIGEIEVENSYPAFHIDSDSKLLKIMDAATQRMGKKMTPKPTGGGSDTNVFNGNGLPSATLAVGMTNVHTTSEYISVESLIGVAELVAAIIQEV